MDPVFCAEPTTVVVAGSQPFTRLGIVNSLQERSDFSLIGEACDGLETLELTSRLRPELLILDGGPAMAELINQCRARHPALKILLLTDQSELGRVAHLHNSGVLGIITKQEPPEVLLQALRVVRTGNYWFSRTLVDKIQVVRADQRLARLFTPTEKKVLEHMLLGKDNLTIAQTLSVTKQTIRRHATVIYEKLGVSNRIQAILQIGRGWNAS